MKTYTVYHVDYVHQKRIPIGTVAERREKPRPDNLSGLLKVARKLFSSGPQEAFHVVLSKRVLAGL